MIFPPLVAPLLTPLPATFVDETIVLNLELGGKPTRFLLDSGSPSSGIEERAGGARADKDGRAPLRAPGSAEVLAAEFQVVSAGEMPQGTPPIEGYLGADFLARHRLLVDYRAGTVMLIGEKAITSATVAALLPKARTSIRLIPRAGTYEVAGGPRLLVDTGAAILCLASHDVPRGAVPFPSLTVKFWDGERPAPSVLMPSFSIAGARYRNCVAITREEENGVVPSRMLTGGRIILDFGGSTLYTEPPLVTDDESRAASHIANVRLLLLDRTKLQIRPPAASRVTDVLSVGNVPTARFLAWLRAPNATQELADLAHRQRSTFRVGLRTGDGKETLLVVKAPLPKPVSRPTPILVSPTGVKFPVGSGTHILPPGWKILDLPAGSKVETDPKVPGGVIVTIPPPM
ncbi:hypothetical protein EON81_15005 [bacterium]|nr:MAG: hypothetical protein EON81_15005 [bacterium]